MTGSKTLQLGVKYKLRKWDILFSKLNLLCLSLVFIGNTIEVYDRWRSYSPSWILTFKEKFSLILVC